MKKKLSLGRITLNLALILISLTYILPLVLMLSISFSSEESITRYGYMFIPKSFSLEAYRLAAANPMQLLQSYKITIMFSLLSTFLAILVQSLMAYPLSRPNYKFKKFVTIYIFVTMLFSGGLVPAYILNTQYLRLGNSFWIYIFPHLISAWNVIIFRTFFQGLPEGMVEAAKIDGAGEFRIFFKIIMPLSKPVVASLGFIGLVGRWNDWNTSLLYIRDPDLYSLQYLLQRILREIEFVKGLAMEGGIILFQLNHCLQNQCVMQWLFWWRDLCWLSSRFFRSISPRVLP